jgi:hypothetical protein
MSALWGTQQRGPVVASATSENLDAGRGAAAVTAPLPVGLAQAGAGAPSYTSMKRR